MQLSKYFYKNSKIFSIWDLISIVIFLGLFFIFFKTGEDMKQHIIYMKQENISLDPINLFEYSLKTTIRMFIALFFSLIFSITYALIAAKCKRLGKVLVLLLDILQSVPVLGYISFTLTAFIALFPGSSLGLECAAIFAIFTAQAWNITFSLYQSFTNIPPDLEEVANHYGLNGWQKLWRLELPFASSGIVWNLMMSVAGSWFFIVASEAITVGGSDYNLPGIGSYISVAVENKNLACIFYAITAMLITILVYDQLFFRPLIVWINKFKIDITASAAIKPTSWFYNLIVRSNFISYALWPLAQIGRFMYKIHFPRNRKHELAVVKETSNFLNINMIFDLIWYLFVITLLFSLGYLSLYYYKLLEWNKALHVIKLASISMLRISVSLIICSLIWIPVGIYCGLRPRLVSKIQPILQFLASFPVNLLFPIFVYLILHFKLNPDIWLSPLVVMGTQWYILFNVMAGSANFSEDLKEVVADLDIKGWLWLKKIMFPAILPYYFTGAITAWGGAWNATIVGEFVWWGKENIQAAGVGAYISQATLNGRLHDVALGILVMSLFVILTNHFFWNKLHKYAVAINK